MIPEGVILRLPGGSTAKEREQLNQFKKNKIYDLIKNLHIESAITVNLGVIAI